MFQERIQSQSSTSPILQYRRFCLLDSNFQPATAAGLKRNFTRATVRVRHQAEFTGMISRLAQARTTEFSANKLRCVTEVFLHRPTYNSHFAVTDCTSTILPTISLGTADQVTIFCAIGRRSSGCNSLSPANTKMWIAFEARQPKIPGSLQFSSAPESSHRAADGAQR